MALHAVQSPSDELTFPSLAELRKWASAPGTQLHNGWFASDGLHLWIESGTKAPGAEIDLSGDRVSVRLNAQTGRGKQQTALAELPTESLHLHHLDAAFVRQLLVPDELRARRTEAEAQEFGPWPLSQQGYLWFHAAGLRPEDGSLKLARSGTGATQQWRWLFAQVDACEIWSRAYSGESLVTLDLGASPARSSGVRRTRLFFPAEPTRFAMYALNSPMAERRMTVPVGGESRVLAYFGNVADSRPEESGCCVALDVEDVGLLTVKHEIVAGGTFVLDIDALAARVDLLVEFANGQRLVGRFAPWCAYFAEESSQKQSALWPWAFIAPESDLGLATSRVAASGDGVQASERIRDALIACAPALECALTSPQGVVVGAKHSEILLQAAAADGQLCHAAAGISGFPLNLQADVPESGSELDVRKDSSANARSATAVVLAMPNGRAISVAASIDLRGFELRMAVVAKLNESGNEAPVLIAQETIRIGVTSLALALLPHNAAVGDLEKMLGELMRPTAAGGANQLAREMVAERFYSAIATAGAEFVHAVLEDGRWVGDLWQVARSGEEIPSLPLAEICDATDVCIEFAGWGFAPLWPTSMFQAPADRRKFIDLMTRTCKRSEACKALNVYVNPPKPPLLLDLLKCAQAPASGLNPGTSFGPTVLAGRGAAGQEIAAGWVTPRGGLPVADHWEPPASLAGLGFSNISGRSCRNPRLRSPLAALLEESIGEVLAEIVENSDISANSAGDAQTQARELAQRHLGQSPATWTADALHRIGLTSARTVAQLAVRLSAKTTTNESPPVSRQPLALRQPPEPVKLHQVAPASPSLPVAADPPAGPALPLRPAAQAVPRPEAVRLPVAAATLRDASRPQPPPLRTNPESTGPRVSQQAPAAPAVPELEAGDRISMTSLGADRSCWFDIECEAPLGFDFEIAGFCLSEFGRFANDDDVVFFNNHSHRSLCLVLTPADEPEIADGFARHVKRVAVCPLKIPESVRRVAIIAVLYNGAELGVTFRETKGVLFSLRTPKSPLKPVIQLARTCAFRQPSDGVRLFDLVQTQDGVWHLIVTMEDLPGGLPTACELLGA